MKKIVLFLLGFFIILQFTSAINLKVEKISQNEVMIADVNKQTVFNLSITNLNGDDYMEFYNLLGFQMFPIGSTPIKKGETKQIQLKISPIGKIKERGYYTLQYFIKGSNDSEIKQELTFKIIELKDAFEVGSEEVNPKKNTIIVYIKNKEKIDFEGLKVKFKSNFFTEDREFELGSEEKKEFEIQLQSEDLKKLSAGFYTLTAEVEYAGARTEVEGFIKFSERSDLNVSERDSGFFISTHTITKTNQGNVNVETVTSIRKSIFSSHCRERRACFELHLGDRIKTW